MIKTNVSPIIYNNGDRKTTIKTDLKEVVFMLKTNGAKNEQLNKLILLDEDLVNYILVTFLNTSDKEDYRNYNNYEFTIDLVKSNHNGIRDKLLSVLNEVINDEVIDDAVQYYNKLVLKEAKDVIYSLSHLLYLQDKHKTNYIGQEIDKTIKEWINLINNTNYEELKKKLENPKKMNKETVREYNALQFNAMIPTLNHSIYNNIDLSFLELNNTNKTTQELKDLLKIFIEKTIHEAKKYNKYSNSIISDFIFNTESTIHLDLFQTIYEKEILAIKKEKDHNKVKLSIKDGIELLEAKDRGLYVSDDLKDYIESDEYFNDLYKLYVKYQETKDYKDLEEKKKDIDKWRIKASDFIEHLETLEKEPQIKDLNLNYMLDHLAYSDYQKETYIITITDEKDYKLFQATARQLKAIDNARGGLVTYTETDAQTIRNKLKEKNQSLKNTHIEKDKQQLKKEIAQLEKDLIKAEQKEKELTEEYKNINNFLNEIYKSMEKEPKTTDYYKKLKKQRKEQEQRKKEIERIINFSGWQLDAFGFGNYELIINKRKHETLKLSVENLSKQIARYTKEEQDMFDFILSKHLHNTHTNEVSFTLREYEKAKNRAKPTNHLVSDIQAIHLLFREVWSYYTNDDTSYTFTEKHLFDNLNIKGELVDDISNLDNANLDTKISLELTETLQNLLKDHENHLYISTPLEVMQLNNDNEYLAKRLLKHLYRKARIEQTNTIKPSLDELIKELQYYGLKQFNQLNRHKTYKTEIVDVMEKCLNILEGENHLNKKFIEVLDRQPFITYDTEYRGKSQETSINEWGKHKIKIKVFNLDDNKLIDMKQKHKKKKEKATKK